MGEGSMAKSRIYRMAIIQMVSFDTHYKHLGRAFSEGKKRYRFGLALYSLLLSIGAFSGESNSLLLNFLYSF